MSKKKRVFLIVAVVFIIVMLFFAYDISQRTSAPWEKKEELLKKYKTE